MLASCRPLVGEHLGRGDQAQPFPGMDRVTQHRVVMGDDRLGREAGVRVARGRRGVTIAYEVDIQPVG